MKKVFDQTVRDLKREVNKKVLKVPGIEQKILDATSNEPWGPHGSNLADIAHATRNYQEYQMIMNVIWRRISDTGKNWRHVYKGLTVLEYLVAHGSERVIEEIKEHAYQISTLSNFQYIDSSGRDQGSNVRRKSQSLVNLVNDKERVQELRQKAQANREKYRSSFSTGRPGGYGDRYDDDRYEGRYGRDEDRYGNGRERESGYRDDDRYGRSGEPYGREGDRYSRDADERYGRDGYRDDDYKGSRGNDDYGSRNGSLQRSRSFDDDDRYSSRSGGGRTDDPQDERQLEHRLSEQSSGAPPTYEEVTRDAQNIVQEQRNGGDIAAASPKVLSDGASSPKVSSAAAPSESTNTAQTTAAAAVSAPTGNFGSGGFDEFDPRGSVAAAPPAATSLEMDFFGSVSDPVYALALMPVDSTLSDIEADVPASSSFGNDFGNLQPGENPFGDPPFKATSENFPAQQEGFASTNSYRSTVSTGGLENLPPAALKMETTTSFDFGGITYASTIPSDQQISVADPAVLSPEVPFTLANDDISNLLASAAFTPPMVQPAAPAHTEAFLPQQTGLQTQFAPQVPQFTPQAAQFAPLTAQATPQATYPIAPTITQPTQMNFLPQSGTTAQTSIQMNQMNLLSQPGLHAPLSTEAAAPMSTMLPAKNPSKDKFETKSTVWADTLSRGLVNLNISGPKINPHADIGIDFDSMNRKDKRTEEKKSSAAPVTSTITMGKAMGSGSGMGRAATSGLARPQNPMMGSGIGMGMGGNAGMGMGMGMNQPMGMNMGMNQPMGMGMGMGMNMGMNQPMGMNMGMGMGMNMGMNQGMPMRPPMGMPPGGPGMPGAGYNPMTGYGSQQPYGGGYR